MPTGPVLGLLLNRKLYVPPVRRRRGAVVPGAVLYYGGRRRVERERRRRRLSIEYCVDARRSIEYGGLVVVVALVGWVMLCSCRGVGDGNLDSALSTVAVVATGGLQQHGAVYCSRVK